MHGHLSLEVSFLVSLRPFYVCQALFKVVVFELKIR